MYCNACTISNILINLSVVIVIENLFYELGLFCNKSLIILEFFL